MQNSSQNRNVIVNKVFHRTYSSERSNLGKSRSDTLFLVCLKRCGWIELHLHSYSHTNRPVVEAGSDEDVQREQSDHH